VFRVFRRTGTRAQGPCDALEHPFAGAFGTPPDSAVFAPKVGLDQVTAEHIDGSLPPMVAFWRPFCCSDDPTPFLQNRRELAR
jgi:hypothetical protein